MIIFQVQIDLANVGSGSKQTSAKQNSFQKNEVPVKDIAVQRMQELGEKREPSKALEDVKRTRTQLINAFSKSSMTHAELDQLSTYQKALQQGKEIQDTRISKMNDQQKLEFYNKVADFEINAGLAIKSLNPKIVETDLIKLSDAAAEVEKYAIEKIKGSPLDKQTLAYHINAVNWGVSRNASAQQIKDGIIKDDYLKWARTELEKIGGKRLVDSFDKTIGNVLENVEKLSESQGFSNNPLTDNEQKNISQKQQEDGTNQLKGNDVEKIKENMQNIIEDLRKPYQKD